MPQILSPTANPRLLARVRCFCGACFHDEGKTAAQLDEDKKHHVTPRCGPYVVLDKEHEMISGRCQ